MEPEKASEHERKPSPIGCILLLIICCVSAVIASIVSLRNDEPFSQTIQLEERPNDLNHYLRIAEERVHEWNSSAMLKLANGGLLCEPGHPIPDDRGMVFFFSAKQFYFGPDRLAMARVTIDENTVTTVAGPSQGFGWPGIDLDQMNVDIYEAISLTISNEKLTEIVQQPECMIEFWLNQNRWSLSYYLDSVPEDDKIRFIRFDVDHNTGEVTVLPEDEQPIN